jgi:hypothetical protein
VIAENATVNTITDGNRSGDVHTKVDLSSLNVPLSIGGGLQAPGNSSHELNIALRESFILAYKSTRIRVSRKGLVKGAKKFVTCHVRRHRDKAILSGVILRMPGGMRRLRFSSLPGMADERPREPNLHGMVGINRAGDFVSNTGAVASSCDASRSEAICGG